jgi:transcriptional regulator with XRE-family HTH domain
MTRFSPILTERAVKLSMDRFLASLTAGKRIRWAREEAQLSRAELAEYVGFSVSTLANIEHGKRGLRPNEKAAIASALGCSIALLTVEPNNNGWGRRPRARSNGLVDEPQLSLGVEEVMA